MNQCEFLEVFVLAERLHRQFLEVIQLELEARQIRDLNNVRALMLLNIGDAEMTASELLWRGCYLGSNVSYNLKKLTEAGYVIQERSTHDKRVIMVRNSPKGAELCAVLQDMNARNINGLVRGDFRMDDLRTCREMLRTLQRFWSRAAEVDSPASHASFASVDMAKRAPSESPPALMRQNAEAYAGLSPSQAA